MPQAEAASESSARLASEQPDERATGSRLGVPFNADGTIDTEAMRTSTRDRLRAALSDPTLASRLGMEQAPAAQSIKVPAILFERAAALLSDTVGKLAVVAVARQGYPVDQALSMLMSADDHAVLDPLIVKALDDWCPVIEGKYVSLYMLGAGALSVFAPKYIALRKPATVHPFPQQQQPEQPS